MGDAPQHGLAHQQLAQELPALPGQGLVLGGGGGGPGPTTQARGVDFGQGQGAFGRWAVARLTADDHGPAVQDLLHDASEVLLRGLLLLTHLGRERSRLGVGGGGGERGTRPRSSWNRLGLGLEDETEDEASKAHEKTREEVEVDRV